MKLLLKRLIKSGKIPYYSLFCLVKGLGWDNTWTFYGLPVISQDQAGSITIGKNFIACSKVKKNSIGVIQPVILRTIGKSARIQIGNNVGISGCSIVSRERISFGDNVLVGSGALIMDNDAHPLAIGERANTSKIKSKPVIIEDFVFIGARSIISKGVTLGRGSVVGAGSVVTKNVGPNEIVGGNPARVIGVNL